MLGGGQRERSGDEQHDRDAVQHPTLAPVADRAPELNRSAAGARTMSSACTKLDKPVGSHTASLS